MYAIIYENKNHPHNNAIKAILQKHGVTFTSTIIGEDLINEEVSSLYPAFQGNTVVAIDGAFVGGIDEVRHWAATQPTFLAE